MNINHDALITAAQLRLNERRREASTARLVSRSAPRRRFRVVFYLPLLHWSFSFTLTTA
jgi:hypothetical protein